MRKRVGKKVEGGDADPVPRRRASSSDRPLVQACLRGDESAWAALIHKYKNLIYSIPIKYGGSPEDAADIFQRVSLELFTELPRLRNTDSLRPWLMTVTAHQAYHWKRQRQRAAGHEVDGLDQEALPDPLPAALASEVEREQVVREAVARLPPRCQELVRMLFFEHPPRRYAEVARTLGLAEGSIGFIRGRCLSRLHRLLEELGF
jgi:RNA polymerase sigma factor (sigma-70 family)